RELAEGVEKGGRFARFAAPAALAVAPIFEAATGAYEAHTAGEGTLGIAGAAGTGAAKGLIDTYLPGARDGYRDIWDGNKTLGERILNLTGDTSGTGMAISSTALLASRMSNMESLRSWVPTSTRESLRSWVPTSTRALLVSLSVDIGTNLVK